MNKALRTCLRITPSRILRCQQSSSTSRCLASAICPARNLTSTTSQPTPSSRPTSQSAQRRIQSKETGVRAYSTREGTIAKGAEGIPDEIQRSAEALVAPDHLDEKEREIFSLLISSLNPTSLNVRPSPSHFPQFPSFSFCFYFYFLGRGEG